jgi:hypothetical protein
MSSSSADRIGILLAAVRRRLWIERLWDDVQRTAWASAALVLGGAAWHLALHAHSGSWTAMGAGAVLAVPLLARLGGRPSSTAAARCADRWFDGNELMTSAHDQLCRNPTDRAGAADFVLASAAESAVRWGPQLRARPLGVAPGKLGGPLLLALVGGFLHLLPGHVPADARARGGPSTVRAAGGHAAKPPPSDGNLTAWRQPAERSAAVDAHASFAGVAPEGAAVEGTVDLPAETTARVPTGGEAGTGNLPGSSASGAGAPDVPARDEPLAARFVDVPRRGGRSTADASTVELTTEPPGDGPRVAATPPAAEGADVRAGLRLSPVLRAYVAAYLRRLAEVE